MDTLDAGAYFFDGRDKTFSPDINARFASVIIYSISALNLHWILSGILKKFTFFKYYYHCKCAFCAYISVSTLKRFECWNILP